MLFLNIVKDFSLPPQQTCMRRHTNVRKTQWSVTDFKATDYGTQVATAAYAKLRGHFYTIGQAVTGSMSGNI